ncbi:hypothetical protein ACFY1P_08090 [Streptomyces sp. NPDC001407]|uniref:hypothetical protein n=1 Tax=Streptomyces sp. NPDC001407 TaxID=3364573 RepID=UPI00369DB97D
MSPEMIGLLVTLLGGGGVTALAGAIFKGLRDRKADYEKFRSEHISDLARWRDELDDKLRDMENLLRYYKRLAASYEYQLRSNGITPEVPPDIMRELPDD